MFNNEKKLLTNDNMEKPDEGVLKKARSSMREKKSKQRLNIKQISAIASACAVLLVLIICIPFMLPASSAMSFVYNSDLYEEEIESISSFNEIENFDILHFNTSDLTTKYIYNNSIVLLEEYSTSGNTHIKMLVKFDDNCRGLSFQKEEEYTANMQNSKESVICKTSILYSENCDNVCVNFTKHEFSYYVLLVGETSNWQKFIEQLLN